jgi:phosphatidylserine/phosphatidylglycerophosphate/cardiolipin synthase-like enzyme
MDNLTLHTDWPLAIATDITGASSLITITALSMHQPRHDNGTDYATLYNALAAAPARGVQCVVYMPDSSSSHPATSQNRTTAAALARLGCTVHTIPVSRLLHAKTVSIDDAIIWVGSGNWSAAAAHFNHECYLRANAPQLAARLREHWQKTLLEGIYSWQK